jgi:tetratricopeptide (TPR) repeat protein
MADSQPTVSLDPTGAFPVGDSTVAPEQTTTSTPQDASVGRYILHNEIARGGMGVVYRATDTVLGREVAVKVLQQRLDSSTSAARRFIDEARIAGQLQHPGIPSVHDLGSLPDGRPFLAMKLVKGRTLADYLNERASPAQERGRFVAIFEAICQALGYAHAHNVIHRDLKPTNVMVGAYGEVQVMDWGLAKVLASGGRQAAGEEPTVGTEIRTQRDSDGSETQAGSVLGTPAYMPPEQAIGAVDRIDARSDVFGLGAILLVILTGRPPFVADGGEAARQLAARAKLEEAFAALDVCDAEPELVALCKRCLSPEQQDRPADAGEVARSVAALRAAADERARQAELERVRAEGERARAEAEAHEQRKRRRVQLALAGTLALLLLVGGGAAWWLQAQAAERDTERRLTEAANREAAESALQLAVAALHKDNPVYGEIDAALDQAVRRMEAMVADDLGERVQAARVARQLLERLDEIADQHWTVAAGQAVLDVAGTRDAYRDTFRNYGFDLAAEPAETLAAKIRRSLIAGRLQEALDDWLGVSVDKRQTDGVGVDPKLIDLLAILDPDANRSRTRRGIASKDRTLLGKVPGLNGRQMPPSFAMLISSSALVPEKTRLEILRQAQATNPNAFGLAMATFYAVPALDNETRVAYLRIAVALRPRNAVARHNLGNELAENCDHAEAIPEYKEAIRLNPGFAPTHDDLGRVLQEVGDLDGALVAQREALRLNPKEPNYHNNLGWLLEQQGDLAGALAAFNEALHLQPNHRPASYNLHYLKVRSGLIPRVPDILAGKAEPKGSFEECQFARLFAQPFQKRYAAAVRLFDKAFTADPGGRTLDGNGYFAAIAAAHAALGDGIDSPMDLAERARLRGMALTWLRAEVARMTRLTNGKVESFRKDAVRTLKQWLKGTEYAAFRPGPARTDMPAEEQAEWDKVWSEIRSTLSLVQKQ